MRIALIPARGGSKRIPRKNLRPFAGKPMIAWSIEAAAASGLFERIIVSTDDSEIASVAADLGVEVPFLRPAELSDDQAGTLPVVHHAAQWLAANGIVPEAICCLYATAPFVRPDDLRRGVEMLEQGGWDYVFAAGRFSYPVQRGFTRDSGGAMRLLFPEHRLTRSQDLAPVYHDAGQFYWGLTATWLESRAIFGERSACLELPPWRVQDIDTPEDWTMAEYLFEKAKGSDDGE